MTDAVLILAALAEPTRLAAMQILSDGKEHCVCELMDALGASQSRMSRHMSALKAAGLVADRRHAQWVMYKLKPRLSKPVADLIRVALRLKPNPKRSHHEVLC